MILVTGGTGLVGSHLLFELMKKERAVRAIYRDISKISRVKKLFEYYSNGNPHSFELIEWVEADLLDVVRLEDALHGVSYVYHCAAIVSFARKDFSKMMRVNREGTANVVNLCLKEKIKKIGYISSTAAIGGQQHELISESTKWNNSSLKTGYAISKYAAEKEIWRGVEEGLDAVILNPSIVIGAGSWEESSLTIFRTVEKGLKFYTLGKNAFVDARDIASLLVRLVESKYKNERFLCVSENLKFEELVKQIALNLNIKEPYINAPYWLMSLAWRIFGITAWLLNRNSSITKEMVLSAFSVMEYSNEKIVKLLNHTFIPIKDAVDNAVKGRLS